MKPSQITDYYARLGVSPNAADREITISYRRLAVVWHPDRNGDSKESTEEMQAVNEAYDVLSEPKKRANYDLRRGRNINTNFNPHEFTQARDRDQSLIDLQYALRILRLSTDHALGRYGQLSIDLKPRDIQYIMSTELTFEDRCAVLRLNDMQWLAYCKIKRGDTKLKGKNRTIDDVLNEILRERKRKKVFGIF